MHEVTADRTESAKDELVEVLLELSGPDLISALVAIAGETADR